jgi:hypothetical protein
LDGAAPHSSSHQVTEKKKRAALVGPPARKN